MPAFPSFQAPFVDENGCLTGPWQNLISGLFKVNYTTTFGSGEDATLFGAMGQLVDPDQAGMDACLLGALAAIPAGGQLRATTTSILTGTGLFVPLGNTVLLVVEAVGGGGGGSGSNGGGNGGNGTDTTFGGLTAGHGFGAVARAGGAPGAATGGDINLAGQTGQDAATGIIGTTLTGGSGGSSPRYGGGGLGRRASASDGEPNTGSGGSGGRASGGEDAGAGGGSGGYSRLIILNPPRLIAYAVGAGGAAGTAGSAAGGAGAAGRIDVTEFGI